MAAAARVSPPDRTNVHDIRAKESERKKERNETPGKLNSGTYLLHIHLCVLVIKLSRHRLRHQHHDRRAEALPVPLLEEVLMVLGTMAQ